MSTRLPIKVRIIAATTEDLAAISQLAGCIWRAYYPGIISMAQVEYMLDRMYSRETLLHELSVGGIRYDRLLAADEFAGFASYGPVEESGPTAGYGVTIKLHKIYLHPKWHGKGLGACLLQHCERQARDAGAHRLILAVNKRNAKAIAAYQRVGFAIVQSVIEDIGGGFVMDDYVMQKKLA